MLSSGCLQSRYLLSWNILTLLSFWRSHRLLDCGLLGRDIFACPHCPYHLIVEAAAATTVAIANCYYRHWAIDTFFCFWEGEVSRRSFWHCCFLVFLNFIFDYSVHQFLFFHDFETIKICRLDFLFLVSIFLVFLGVVHFALISASSHACPTCF